MRGQTNTKRSPSIRRSIALAAALILLAARADVSILAGSEIQNLAITASFADKQSVSPRQELAIGLSRPLTGLEGSIAVLIGRTDVSSLLVARDNNLIYTPRVLPLPSGESQVLVYLVSADNIWKQVAQFTLRVESPKQTPTPPSPGGGNGVAQSVDSSGSARSGMTAKRLGFDRANLTPSVTLGMKSQAAELHFPDSSRPPRPTFADFTVQGSVRGELARGSFNSQSQFDVVGTSFRNEALRFGQEGKDAPLIDLASYLMRFQSGKAKFEVGHIAFGANRHLINSFSSRGISISTPVARRVDASIAAMNGTSVVGWSNFLGLNRVKHQFVTSTLGFELIPERRGGLRFEASALDGRLLPQSSFNQANITDAERSRGGAIRLVGADQSQRWRVDAGFARTLFTNPADPLLFQNRDVVPVREVTRNARYLDASFVVLRDLKLSEARKANVSLNYRHERVDPLYRSVAAFVQADRNQNQLEMVAVAGEVTATVSHQRFNDNLSDVPSVLKSLSRRTNLILGTPLASLLGNAAKPSRWLPRVSYSFDEMHQFAASIPVNGGFEVNPSTVPDQVSANQNLTADWQFNKLRVGYRFNRSLQDNRQAQRERADFRNLSNVISAGITPTQKLDLNFDLSWESALNREQPRTDRTLRLASNITWRMTERMLVNALISGTGAGNTIGTNRNRNAELDLQWSYRFAIEKSKTRRVQGQFFVRYANRYASSFDRLFGFSNLTRFQTLNAGLSFTFF